MNRSTVARYAAGYGAIAAAVPYLLLKVAWLTGHPVGFTDPDLVDDARMYALNLFTAGMDAVGILVALAFTHDWGRRLPAWLVTFPMWVGTGFLAPIAVAAPVAALLAGTDGPVDTDSIVRPWVFGVVYTGFVVQGVALITAFAMYARRRWTPLFTTRTGDVPPGPTHDLQVLLAGPAAGLAAAVGLVHLAWAAGLRVGLPPRAFAAIDAAGAFVHAVYGGLALAGAAGALMLTRRIGRPARFRVPLALTWVGAGSMFAWGFWTVLNVLAGSVLAGSEPGDMAVQNLHGLAKLLAGVVIGLVGAFTLAERRAAR